MRELKWIIGAGWISVKVRCEYDSQWEAPKKSSDLVATTIKTKPIRRDYSNQNQIEHWPVPNHCYAVEKQYPIKTENFRPCIDTTSLDLSFYNYTLFFILNSIQLIFNLPLKFIVLMPTRYLSVDESRNWNRCANAWYFFWNHWAKLKTRNGNQTHLERNVHQWADS